MRIPVSASTCGVYADGTWQVLIKAAEQAADSGDWRSSECLALGALEAAEEMEGRDSRLIRTLQLLARIYFSLGHYGQCAPIQKRLVKFAIDVIGTESDITAGIAFNSAVLYHAWGKYVEAAHFYKMALDVKAAMRGADDEQVRAVAGCYVEMLREIECYSEAAELEEAYGARIPEDLFADGKWDALKRQEAAEKNPFELARLESEEESDDSKLEPALNTFEMVRFKDDEAEPDELDGSTGEVADGDCEGTSDMVGEDKPDEGDKEVEKRTNDD